MKNKSTELAYKWLQLLGGLCQFPESEIESTAEQVSDMFYYEVLNGSVPLKNGLDREELKSVLRQMHLSPDRWVSAVDWEGIVSLYSIEEETSETITYTIPARFLPLIFNDDSSGLDDDDVKEWEKFVSDEQLTEVQGHWSYDSEKNEEYFSHQNDVTGYMGDTVVDVEWVIRK